MWSLVVPAALLAASANAQIIATGPNGPTNPDKPDFYPIGAQVNQTSLSRLLTLNSVDDFCLYGPPEPGPESIIGNVEPIVVAYCTKPRNGARLIPDGTIQSAHFIKTPLYVQIHGFWDGTKVNIPYGDTGGELDPHGAKNEGNPIGGNVTSNVVDGKTDVFYEEWMSFIGFDQYCLRICTAETANITTALQCEHELDIMGCRFVMAIEDFYRGNNSFTSCEGDAAAPPGLYPQVGGGFSTFRQRYTGTYTDNGTPVVYTVGHTVTPTAPALWPSVSKCTTYSSIANGVNVTDMVIRAAPTTINAAGVSAEVPNVGTTSMATITSITGLPPPTPSASTPSAGGAVTTTDASGNTVVTTAPGASTGAASSTAAVPVGLVALFGVVAGALALF